MILYMQSPFFGQMMLPQVDDTNFSQADGGIVAPLDGSNWNPGSYVFPCDALQGDGAYLKIFEGVDDGLGGTFDFGIKDQGDGEHWELGRWSDPDDLTSFSYDLNNIPYFKIVDFEQVATSLHFGARWYNNDTQYKAQLAWWISPGDAIYEEYNILLGTWQSARDTSGAFEAFDKTADDDSITGLIVNSYEIWAYHGNWGNNYSNSDVTTANGGAAGYMPRDYRGGDSTANTGSGNYGRFGESLGLPGLAQSGLASCGLITEYHPDPGDLQQLAQYLCDDSFIASVKKTWSSPLESIIALFLLPTAPDATDEVTANIVLGGVDTGISTAKLVSSTFARHISFGKITLKEKFRGMNFLDYDGWKVTIYMPYIGYRELCLKDVINSTLCLDYNVDFLTGDFVAILRTQHTGKWSIQRILLQERGNMSIQVPITSQNYAGVYQGIISGLANVAGGNFINGAMQMLFNSGAISTQRCGSIGGAAAAHASSRAFLKIEYPVPVVPGTFNNTIGQRIRASYKLSDLSGFTIADLGETNLSYMTATEKEEIRRIFQEGVYL